VKDLLRLRLRLRLPLPVFRHMYTFSSPSATSVRSTIIVKVMGIVIHTMVLFFQAITLNVAINSFSNALLTLLVSNQFVEIKSAVFKKFEKENLFQLSCAGKNIPIQLLSQLFKISWNDSSCRCIWSL
jgi:hypothetical protein